MLFALHTERQMKTLRLACMVCLIILFHLLLSPSVASAHDLQRADILPPTLDVTQPTNTIFRDSFWLAVQVTIAHVEAPVSGLLVAQMCNFTGRDLSQVAVVSSWTYQTPVHMNKGEEKQFSLSLPHTMGNLEGQGVLITLLDAHGQELTHTMISRGYEVTPPDVLIGALSDQADALNMSLIRVTLPNQKDTPTTVQLDATTFPTQSTLLSLYTVIILDEFSTSTLSERQVMALRTWVSQGGILIEVGGSQWQRTLAPLPADLLPVSLSGTQSLPAGIALYPLNSPGSSNPYYAQPNQAPSPLTISTASLSPTFSNNIALAASGSTPLVTKAHFGQGFICYLAYDPMQAPLLTWSSQAALWQMLFFSTLGDLFLISDTATTHTTGPGDFLTHSGIVHMLSPEMLIGPWVLLLLLFVYVLFLGPVRFLLIKHLQPEYLWRWRILLISIVLFSLVGYGFAFYQKKQEISDNTVSLLRLNPDGSFAHVTTYHGLFMPNDTSFTLHLPGENLAQPLSNALLTYAHLSHTGTEVPFTLTYNQTETAIQMYNSTPWVLHSLVTERDASLQGRIRVQLHLSHGHLVGTVSNTLPAALKDLYVLFPHGFARIGSLAAGESRMLDLSLSLTPPGTQEMLANQIAQQGGLATPYFPYATNGVPHSDFEHHMALLSALSGTGGTLQQCPLACSQQAFTTPGTLYFSDLHMPNPEQIDQQDPLALSEAPATLIGWMDQGALPGSEVTMNETRTPLPGQHENFLQMPLSLDIATLDQMPANFIQGHVVDIEGFNAQVILPGVYTFSNGGLTFEIATPHLAQQPSGFTIAIPDLLATPRGLDRFTGVTNLQALLYNWQTHQWDQIHLQQNSFTSHKASEYLSQDQRMLVHISNGENNLGRLIFGTPSLSLQG